MAAGQAQRPLALAAAGLDRRRASPDPSAPPGEGAAPSDAPPGPEEAESVDVDLALPVLGTEERRRAILSFDPYSAPRP